MKAIQLAVLLPLAWGGLGPAVLAAGTNQASSGFDDRSTGRYGVESVRYDWFDAKRERKVPVKIYYPRDATGRLPVIVFSHGLGGSREGYEYLGRHWASCGYVSVHLQHLGSDNAVWQGVPPSEIMGNMRLAAANLQNITNRPVDVSFAIDQIELLNKTDSPFKQRLDLDKIGVAGHSFGAFTTLAVAGETFFAPGGKRVTVTDPRVKAAIAMSSPVPKTQARLDEAFGSIRIPCLHMTGTQDSSPIGETTVEDRRLPFDHSDGADQFLVTFQGGDHMIFSGRGWMGGGEKDETFQKFIRIGSTAFWDAYLKGDASAKAWFTGGGFKGALGQEGAFEMKLCKRR